MLQSGQYGRLLEPGLRKIFMDTYQEIPEQFSKVFRVQKSNKAIETDLRMGGFGLWEKKDSSGPIKLQDTPDSLPIQYIHEEFASGFEVERKLIDDESYNVINKMPRSLGRAARATIETRAAEVINNAFTVNGFDGVPLISNAHPTLEGKLQSNRLQLADGAGAADGALSDRNLKAAFVQMRKTRDEKGILIQCKPTKLVVPPSLEFQARTLLESANLSVTGTGSGMTNDKNVINGKVEVVVMDYLTSNTAWFLLDDSVHELNFFWRKPLEFKNEEDFSTMKAKYRGYCRFSAGFSDWRGVFGSLGTGAV